MFLMYKTVKELGGYQQVNTVDIYIEDNFVLGPYFNYPKHKYQLWGRVLGAVAIWFVK